MLKKIHIPASLSLILIQGILNINHAQDITNHRIDSLLTNNEYRVFKDLALRKTKELSNYIITITTKNLDNDIKMTSIDQAVKLFINEEKTVEVSSINHERIGNFKIREYLNRIKSLDYRQIIITWYDIHYISDFQRGPDGRYYAVITVFQKFEGIRGDRIIYSDVTQKNIEVVIDRIAIKIGDKVVERWDVLLGNISVIETMPS